MMITGVRWFTNRDGCMGIVQIVQDHQKDIYRQTGEADFKYYIGVGSGLDEKADMNHIADYGCPFDKAPGDVLFGV
jgi:hypothetical protein